MVIDYSPSCGSLLDSGKQSRDFITGEKMETRAMPPHGVEIRSNSQILNTDLDHHG